jgi:hypothetical protein
MSAASVTGTSPMFERIEMEKVIIVAVMQNVIVAVLTALGWRA